MKQAATLVAIIIAGGLLNKYVVRRFWPIAGA